MGIWALGHGDIGALGHWGIPLRIDALGHWGIGMGALGHWGIGALVHWRIGALALGHWRIGALVWVHAWLVDAHTRLAREIHHVHHDDGEQHGRAGDPLLVDLVSVGGRVGVWVRVGARVGVGVGLGVRLDHTE